jgi:SAM-dependent methyltransferase
MDHFFQNINGWFNFREIYDDIVREAQSGASFVEVGSWYGRSAAYMAVEIANSDKQIDFYCVDTWGGSVDSPWMAIELASKGGSAFPFFQENMRKGGVEHLIKPVRLNSVQAAGTFEDQSLDFVMIDGAHDYASVRNDVRSWFPKVKPGGVIAGDDVLWPGVVIGVHETIPCSEIALINSGANWWHRKQRPARGEWLEFRPSARPVDYLAYIPYVNRPDLLDRAVASVPELWESLVVIDQSCDGLNSCDHPWMAKIAGVYRSPFRSMSFSQMMNWAQAEAFDRRARYLVFMHNDAQCAAGEALKVLECARARRAGVVFTNYDAFAVFNVAALRDIGPWDETFRWYFSDNDYYRRMQLRGWEHYLFGGDGVVHHGSQTLQSASAIKNEVGESWRWHQDHYSHKWGGPPGRERHSIPYNGKP